MLNRLKDVFKSFREVDLEDVRLLELPDNLRLQNICFFGQPLIIDILVKCKLG